MPEPVLSTRLPPVTVRPAAVGDLLGEPVTQPARQPGEPPDVLVLPLTPASGASGGSGGSGGPDRPDPPAEPPSLVDPAAGPVLAQATGVGAPELAALLRRSRASGAVGQLTWLPPTKPEGRQVLLAGFGDASPVAQRRAGAALARAARGRREISVDLAGLPGEGAGGAEALVEGLLLGGYTFSRRSAAPDRADRPVGAVVLAPPGEAEPVGAAAARGSVAARATEVARDLANTPADTKDPAWLADRAAELAHPAGLQLRVWEPDDLARDGFGGLLAVGAGSVRGPRLVQLRYLPDGPASAGPHVVLVGKGITFDSGGLSLKPSEAMVAMKTDMAGAGAVLATMSQLAAAGVPARVTALLALAENLPGASALRPGDVVTHYGGRTVEVLNTDAEGRLVLADALAYADTHLDPDVVVDLATLTGAATLGLGRRHAALFTSDDGLAAELGRAGERSGERVWRLPLVEDYRAAMDSPVADLANVSRDPAVQGGAITAALFLREFAGSRRWAHLDIAGPARADSDAHELTKGATGFGARLLLAWLSPR